MSANTTDTPTRKRARKPRKSVPAVEPTPAEPRKSRRTRKSAVEPKPSTPRTPRPEGSLSAAEVARTAGIDARAFRAFLRSKAIERTFTDAKAAKRAVAAFRKSLSTK